MSKLGFYVRLKGTPFAGDVQECLEEHGEFLYRIRWGEAAKTDLRLYRADELENADCPPSVESRIYAMSPNFDRKAIETRRANNAIAGMVFDPRRIDGAKRS